MIQAEIDLMVITAQQGNEKAFGVLYSHYLSPLIGFAFKICGDGEIANDAVQEAWIKAAKNIRQLNDPRAFKSWIYRLVRWKTIDLVRASSKREQHFDSFDEASISTEKSAEYIEASESNNNLSVVDFVDKLPKVEREIIHLFYLEDFRVAEIAAVLSIPIGTVKSRLNRARNILKKKYLAQK